MTAGKTAKGSLQPLYQKSVNVAPKKAEKIVTVSNGELGLQTLEDRKILFCLGMRIPTDELKTAKQKNCSLQTVFMAFCFRTVRRQGAMNTKIIDGREAVRLLFDTHPQIRQDAWYPILFGGDRLFCCDEAAIVEIDGKIVALATIAPEGEMEEGTPTIVGLYTVRAHRKQGCGKAALEAAVRRCLARGFSHIRVDAISPNALRTIQSLSEELQAELVVNDQSMFGGSILD